MKIDNKFNFLRKIGLCAVLSGWHPAIAGSFGQPVISSSLTDCEKYYLIQIFENGRVEFRGGIGVKALGRHQTQISQQALNALLKKFDVADPTLTDERENLPAIVGIHGPMEAIRLHYGGRELTFYEFGGPSKAWFEMLQHEIIRTTQADKGVTNPKRGLCLENHAVFVKYLKVKK